MINKPFVHLRVHSQYSLVDGIASVQDLVTKAVALDMPALAVTDHANLFALVKFYKAAIKEGIKPIIGADLWVENEKNHQSPYLLTFLCQNDQGYRHLCQLLSRMYLEGKGVPRLRKDWLTERELTGLIVLSGGWQGDVGQALLQGNVEQAKSHLTFYQSLFKHCYYIELTRTNHPDEFHYEKAILPLADMFNLPLVATNAVCFIEKDDFHVHQARVCIQHGYKLNAKEDLGYRKSQFLKSACDMASLFSDLPQAIENTFEITKRCTLELTLNTYCFPDFPIPKGVGMDDYFENQAKKGLDHHLKHALVSSKIPANQYHERLVMELDIIKKMGFSSYFLIVADFVKWAKSQGIRIAPGRGSGPGSLVAYALGITGLDPLAYDLLFERFLNPERVSLPDFDIDFCMENRDRVIQYVSEKYGRKNVAQIITYGSMAARAVVRDVGRILDHPYGFVDKLAKLIPLELGMTLKKALEQEQELKVRFDSEEEVNTLITLAAKLEGTPRNVGKHAAGVVIAPTVLTNFTPLYYEPKSNTVITQLDKDDIESMGLVKFDFLGLRTLTIIDWTLKMIAKREADSLIDMDSISLEDPGTYTLLKSSCTTAVFQLESRGMRELIKRVQPDCFEEVIALVALIRPGPAQSGMVDDFINRKHRRAPITYLHPKLESVLKSTYGVILYQEQVMQIAQILAGYSLGEADILRKAMGKKNPEVMKKQRQIFVEGAVKREVPRKQAESIFDIMEKFAGYGFNKSHSVSYALITYQTAWLKVHYPAEFMASVLSSDMDHTDKLVLFIRECQRMKLKVYPPNINEGEYAFLVSKSGEIIYGLGAIKGLGEPVVKAILKARTSKKFENIADFCRRVDLQKMNKRVWEALIASGALDVISQGVHRAVLMASIQNLVRFSQQHSQNKSSGQGDLLGGMQQQSVHYEFIESWDEAKAYHDEKKVLGWYASVHPMENYWSELKSLGVLPLAKLVDIRAMKTIGKGVVAGVIESIKVMMSRSGKKIAFLELHDGSALLEVSIYGEVYMACESVLLVDYPVIIQGDLKIDAFSGAYSMRADHVYSLSQARYQFAKQLIFLVEEQLVTKEKIDAFSHLLARYPKEQSCPMVLVYIQEKLGRKHFLELGDRWRIALTDEVLNVVKNFWGEGSMHLNYHALQPI